MLASMQHKLRQALVAASAGNVDFDVPLHSISHWRVGGKATAVVCPRNSTELAATLEAIASFKQRHIIVGATSNLLFDSRGYYGVIVKIGQGMDQITVNEDLVSVGAGAAARDVARAAGQAGLAGIEHIVGIPGTLGGLVVMNGGSQRKYIGDNVELVRGIGPDGELRTIDSSSLTMGYRSSGVEKHEIAITEVHLRLPAREPSSTLQQRMDEIVRERAAKFPLSLPSCGSTFLSDPDMYATVGPPGRAIEAAGLKGLSRGRAQISPIHANFIVNRGGATSDDILWLIRTARDRVKAQTGYDMACEARYVDIDGNVVPADVAADERWRELEDS